MNERRRAERIAMTPPANPVSVVGARIIDASPYGMMIESRVAISPDAVLPFRIVVDGRTSDMSCRVATCRSAAGGDQRSFGVASSSSTSPPKRVTACRTRCSGARSRP